MGKWIDLTLPLYDYMPVGNVWAWDVPFQSTPITSDTFNGYELTMITMFSETGTRLMIRAMQDADAPKVHELPLDTLMMQDAVVVELPCQADDELFAVDIEKAFANVTLKKGDAIILRTGWGDDENWVKLGDDYARTAPHLSKEAAEKLVEIMKENESELVGTDIPYWGGGRKYQLPQWASKPAWERNPFPSVEAKRFLANYTLEKAYEDFPSPHVLNSADVMYIGAMCNLGEIRQSRVKLSVLPLKVQGARGATCNVVAFEE
ncbi:cyclase family protein [Alkalihalobacillus oceani]|uniref:cyclase family protein n=1 Tax=Halalkalibacter oceani TaxID=1653776 RepID=UPI002041975D|nr:cyclase family protein [Halalkalibacter oceani]MCM3759948.1 cyclase family protein [Halalkalibacter oceani]